MIQKLSGEDGRIVLVHENRPALSAAVAEKFYNVVGDILAAKARAHVVFTGGSVGGEVLAAIAASPHRDQLDWNRVEIWWGDERWLPAGDPERNDSLAEKSLLNQLVSSGVLDPARIHRFNASDGDASLEEAAAHYAGELANFSAEDGVAPDFDLVFLGVGPDGHIASLFPGRDGIRVDEPGVIAVRDSPKPPPERLSLTLPMINRADRIWLCLAGADKAAALGLALAGARAVDVPAAGVTGRLKTVFFIDAEAAVEMPPELLA